jgi:peptide/nickel transport system substrate-binding protein
MIGIGVAIPGVSTLVAACSSPTPAAPAISAPTQAAPAVAPTVAAAATTVAAAAPTVAAAAAAAGTKGGTAVVSVASSPASWDLTSSTWPTWQGVHFLYDTLLTTDENEKLQPGLVTDWMASDDAMTYTLKLRPNVMFHDNTPFNVDALRFNFERHQQKEDSAFYQAFKPVKTVDAVDDHTAKVTLSEPRPDFLYDLSFWGSLQLSPTAAKTQGTQPGGAGTGPYKFQAYEQDSHIDVVRFDGYWGGAPLLDGVRVRIIPESAVEVTEMQAKSVDVAQSLDPKDVDAVKKTGASVENHTTPGAQFVSMNVTQAPTSELAVRKAIARAIDRDTIMQKVLFGLPEKALSGTPKNSPYYSADVPGVDYNPQEAANILDQAGWTMGPDGIRQRNGQPLTLHILSSDFSGWGTYNQIFQDQLKAIGIDSTITTEEWNTYLNNWRENKEGWNVTYHSQGSAFNSTTPIDASWAPSAFWNICQIGKSTDPDTKKVSDQLEAINQEFLKTSDAARRKDLAKQAQTIYADQQLVAWLWFSPSLVAVQSRLKNYDLNEHGRVIGLAKASLG